MTILLGILVMLIVVIAFVLSVKSGQYDDLDKEAWRILAEDETAGANQNHSDSHIHNNNDHKQPEGKEKS